jgi:DNA-directed RNA polymerase specialized sigma24 family protein
MQTITELKPELIESVSSFYERLYDKVFLKVATFISKRGGTIDDAKDLYHDALMIYYERSVQLEFELHSTEEAYIMGITKNLWSQKLKEDLKTHSLDDEYVLKEEKADFIDHQHLYKVIITAGKKCLDMLSMFYVKQSALREVASAFGFKSEHSAAVQKYKCLEKIRETIRQNSLHHEDFFE